METEKKTISRKEFLSNTSKLAVGAVVGVAGFNLLTGKKAFGETKEAQAYTWPYPYATLDVNVVRQNAHALYYSSGGCMVGAFGGLVQALGNAIGSPWTELPIELGRYGAAGISSWGTTCGALNGAAAIISLVVSTSTTNLLNELFGYYTTENFPSDAGNAAIYVDHPEIGVLAQTIAGSPLCHASNSQWCIAAGFTLTSPERKERCARLAGDIAAKTAELLNAHFASTFVPTFVDPADNANCTGCHGASADNNASTHMECVTCHESIDLGTHGTKVNEISGFAGGYLLENSYPNPFTNSTNIKFSIPNKEKVRLEIYDIKGTLVSSLIDSDVMQPGTYESKWNGTNNAGNKVTDGIYFARLTAGSYMKTIKINLLN